MTYCDPLTREESKRSLSRMENNKSSGLEDIPVEYYKCSTNVVLESLTVIIK